MDRIKLPKEIAEQIIKYFSDHLPEEACGILAGKNDVVTINLPITNQAHSPVRYYMAPVELFKALELIDQQQLQLIAIYHSHPHGPARPSESDINKFLYPGVGTIIGFTDDGDWHLKAFIIEDKRYEEIDLVFLEES